MEESLAARAVRAAGGAEALLKAWGPKRVQAMLSYWPAVARPKQLEPSGDWLTWLVKAGRGFGKTRVGAETVLSWVMAGKAKRIALVAPTAGDARDVMVEGESGILVCSARAGFPGSYEPSKRRITWPNGAIATLFSAEEPDRLRGPQHDAAWLDELGSWQRAEETFNMLQFGLRLGDRPRKVITTTPRPTALVKAIIKDPTTKVTEGSTYENQANLAATFIDDIKRRYEGTRLGLQEIHAVVLDDNPGALWKLVDIERLRIRMLPGFPVPVNQRDALWQAPDAAVEPADALARSLTRRAEWAKLVLHTHAIQLDRIVVACDPSGSDNKLSDECGIVIAGAGMCRCRGVEERHAFVLDDISGTYSPAQWGMLLVRAYNAYGADRIVAEINYGGALVESNLRAADGGGNLPYTGVHVRKGKHLRAEPVSGLAEQGKDHHVGCFPRLEDELTSWDPQDATAKSPNRLDAKVYAETELMIDGGVASFAGLPSSMKWRR